MSGVFSMASHWVLQYLPDVVMQEQTECAHFSPLVVAISFLLSFGSTASDPDGILDAAKIPFCPKRNTLQFLFRSEKEKSSGGNSSGSAVAARTR
jgi:hypothetical protein